MLIVHGIYRWFPCRVAFRNAFCLTCDAPRRVEQVSTLSVLHVFWIPLVPLGTWKRWACTVCGKCPSASVKTRFSFKVAGAVILLGFSVCFWILPVIPEDAAFIWTMRVGAPLGAAATIIHLLTATRDTSYAERSRLVTPTEDAVCPFCGVELVHEFSEWSCPFCYVKRA